MSRPEPVVAGSAPAAVGLIVAYVLTRVGWDLPPEVQGAALLLLVALGTWVARKRVTPLADPRTVDGEVLEVVNHVPAAHEPRKVQWVDPTPPRA